MKGFSKELLSWYWENKRNLPFRGTRDPYIIWLSEIILQQTRVDQGLPYFQKFFAEFPDLQRFSNGSEKKILKLWQGLGYYSRARNMMETAKQVMKAHKGKFPNEFSALKKLKGIGDYTAAAIASIAFGLPYPAIDGNARRVLSRYAGISEDCTRNPGKKIMVSLAEKLLDKKFPGDFNQGLMELGATVCKPIKPNCSACPVSINCVAFQTDTIPNFPFKVKKKKAKQRFFHFFIQTKAGKLLMVKRPQGDIWANLYDLPWIELPKETSAKKLTEILNAGRIFATNRNGKHVLSHQVIHWKLYKLPGRKMPEINGSEWVKISQLERYPFSRLAEKILTNEKIIEKKSNK